MTVNESIADVFLRALKSLSKEQKDSVILRIVQDEEFRYDLQDYLCFENRKDEPTIPFREYLIQKKVRKMTLPGCLPVKSPS